MATMPFVLLIANLSKVENVWQDEDRDGPQTFLQTSSFSISHKSNA